MLARSGRPGPVLVDVPKDIQQQLGLPVWDEPLGIQGYLSRLPQEPRTASVAKIYEAIKEAKKPVRLLRETKTTAVVCLLVCL